MICIMKVSTAAFMISDTGGSEADLNRRRGQIRRCITRGLWRRDAHIEYGWCTGDGEKAKGWGECGRHEQEGEGSGCALASDRRGGIGLLIASRTEGFSREYGAYCALTRARGAETNSLAFVWVFEGMNLCMVRDTATIGLLSPPVFCMEWPYVLERRTAVK